MQRPTTCQIVSISNSRLRLRQRASLRNRSVSPQSFADSVLAADVMTTIDQAAALVLDCSNFCFDRAATGGARLNLEARALAAGSGVKMWSAGGRRGEQYVERSGRRTPTPYNRPRSHRAATATVGMLFRRLN